jgi:hypothetical protein
MQDVNFVLNTAGNGLWSNVAKPVRVVKLELSVWDDELEDDELPDYGELKVYFDTADWDTYEDGLIYTDSQFESELAINLVALGFDATAAGSVGYSEQGMQGDNYVSLDAGEEFVRAWAESGRAFN